METALVLFGAALICVAAVGEQLNTRIVSLRGRIGSLQKVVLASVGLLLVVLGVIPVGAGDPGDVPRADTVESESATPVATPTVTHTVTAAAPTVTHTATRTVTRPPVPTDTPASTHTITYKVDGSADLAFLTYSTPSGGEQWDVDLPWQKSFKASEDAFNVPQVSAQNPAAQGDATITCEIHVDGRKVKTAKSSGPGSIADCVGGI